MTTDEQLWTKRQVAAFLGVSIRTVERMPLRRVPIPPTGRGTGKKPIVRYEPATIRAYLTGKQRSA